VALHQESLEGGRKEVSDENTIEPPKERETQQGVEGQVDDRPALREPTPTGKTIGEGVGG